MPNDNSKKQWSQAVTHVLCIGGGAAVSAAICGYIVTRKIQAYADVLKKASENLEARNTEERVVAKAVKQSPTGTSRQEVLLPYKRFEDIPSPFDASLLVTPSVSVPQSPSVPSSPERPAEIPQGTRTATAPLPQVSSAQEDPDLMEPAQDMANPCAASPFGAFAQKPHYTPPRNTFETSSLFQSSARPPAAAPQQGSDAHVAPASHTVHQDKLLPPRGPLTAGQPAAPLPFDAPLDTWRNSLGSKGSSLGGASRTSSSDLDKMHGIPLLLRSRASGTGGSALPELGALLGRGSFGKVYKGRWKGAMVAVKIIEHSADINSKIESFRETMVSSNIQHPNVLITYKVITCGQHGMISGQQAGSLDSASGSRGQCPTHLVGQPPKASLPPLGRSNSDFEEIQVWLPTSYSSSTPCKRPLDLATRFRVQRPTRVVKALRECLLPPTPPHSDPGQIQETWLLSEFCDKGNMDRALSGGRFHDKGTSKPEMVAIYRCLLDIAAGMDYLHSIGVLHGDLKGGNVLMKSTSMYDDPRGFVCKIGDFGLSRVLEHNSTHISTNTYGTVSYCAPELLKEGKLTKAADVYSFAMIMWEMYSGTALFRGMNSSQVFFKVISGFRPAVPPDMPDGYTTLMKACWHENPLERPPFEDIVAYLRSLYVAIKNDNGQTRDARRSLDLNPWG